MGGKEKKSTFHEVIKSPEHFEEIIEMSKENGPIAIIDVHLERYPSRRCHFHDCPFALSPFIAIYYY